MKIKTLKDLKNYLDSLSEEQLQMDFTVMDINEEFYGFEVEAKIEEDEDGDVLDYLHPYFVIDFEINK